MGYINHNVTVEKSRKGRRVFSVDGYAGWRELLPSDIYVDPQTHVLMRYKETGLFRRPRAFYDGAHDRHTGHSDRNDLKVLDQLKVPAIVRQDDEPVAYGGRPDKKVKVADGLALGSQTASFATEDSRGFVVESD